MANFKVTDEIYYIGVNDHEVDLFEGQYVVPNGMAYNSYVIKAEKTAVVDTVDVHFSDEWLSNIKEVLGEDAPDYIIIHHMEPDHAGSIDNFMKAYPTTTIVSSQKAFAMMNQFFGTDYADRQIVVKEGDALEIGSHTLAFVEAPMVHWPEVIVSYDVKDKVLFSADGFGKFGALDVDEDWACEARRYFIGIVGKYGEPVQTLLKKAATLDIQIICPTHGPVLTENLGYYLNLYDTWSSYRPEEEGILIAYTSVYGNTKKAVELLAEELVKNGAPKVSVMDLARDDMAEAVEDAFRYSKIVLATTSYNASIFPFMHTFINNLTERNYQNRTVAFIENGSWAPCATKVMKDLLKECKDLKYVKNNVTIFSALNEHTENKIKDLAVELCREYTAQNSATANKEDMTALFNLGYGLYVITSNDGTKDNGMIGNTVVQLTNTPNRIGVAINKSTYTHDVVKETGKMVINCLSEEAPFSVFEHFGFNSGRDVDKFEGCVELRADNGIRFLPKYINSFMALEVESYIDMDTHGLFVCSITESRTFNNNPTMSYSYYFDHVKPKPNTEGKTGYVCKTCGWIYEGDELPEDIVCPLCNHGYNDFEKIEN